MRSQLLVAALAGAADAVLLAHHDAAVPADAASGRRRLELEQVRQTGVSTAGVGRRCRRLLVERRAEVLTACHGRPAFDRCQLYSCCTGTGGSLEQVEWYAIIVHLAPCQKKSRLIPDCKRQKYDTMKYKVSYAWKNRVINGCVHLLYGFTAEPKGPGLKLSRH